MTTTINHIDDTRHHAGAMDRPWFKSTPINGYRVSRL